MTAIAQDADGVSLTVRSGDGEHQGRFDLLVAADGTASITRGLVLRPEETQTFDTGWGGWVAWAESDPDHTDLYAETWGRGFFVGRYPVRGRVGVFVGGPRAETVDGAGPFVSELRHRLAPVDPMTARALDAVGDTEDPFHWSFTDTRADRWAIDRVVLLGDAAAGFLPTAGVGAAMALESAAVLAAELATVHPSEVPDALRGYERRQRPRVLAAHDNSRQLDKLMFRRSRVLCTLRDIAARAATLTMALRPILRLHRSAPLTDSRTSR